MLLQYAREHHFPNPTFFVDDGVSGVTYDRPGFQAMLAEIEAGRVAVAIAKDLSRLGRNSALTGLYTNFTFPQNGVRFIAINDNYDTIDPNRVDNDFAGIKNWFNEFYARDTSRKIRAVQKAKGERGVPLTTNVPYGYVKDLENPRRWVVDPVAADVVKRIFDLCMKGRGPMQIANQLKADKVLTPSAYGTQFCMNGETLASIIADAPIKMPPDEDAGHPGNVAASFTAQPMPPAVPAQSAPVSQPPQQMQPQTPAQQPKAAAPEPPKTVDEYMRVMTIEQAKAVKVDFGRFNGWTLGDIAMKNPGDLAWYVKNYSGHNLALKAGATKLLEAVGQMAS